MSVLRFCYGSDSPATAMVLQPLGVMFLYIIILAAAASSQTAAMVLLSSVHL